MLLMRSAAAVPRLQERLQDVNGLEQHVQPLGRVRLVPAPPCLMPLQLVL